jgi:hypothetical protein
VSNKESVATGFVKPKTTSIFFDKIWITEDLIHPHYAGLGYAYIPDEVLLKLTIEMEYANILPLIHNVSMNRWKDFLVKEYPVAFRNSHEMIEYFCYEKSELSRFINSRGSAYGYFSNEVPSIKEDLDIPENIVLRDWLKTNSPKYKYSNHRNSKISNFVDAFEREGYSITPVYFSSTSFENSIEHSLPKKQCVPAISICINEMPEIVEEKLDWEQVLDIRKDKESAKKSNG